MPGPTTPAFVVFDVCDTLYDANTTFGFLRHHAERTRSTRLNAALRAWASTRTARGLVAAASLKVLRIDLARIKVIAALRGELRDTLEQTARDYVDAILPRTINAAVHERLREHQRKGDRVVLISSSLDIVVAEIARVLGVDFSASVLEFVGDRCTGRLAVDLTGRKAEIAGALRRGEGLMHVYTDNRTDIDLLTIADRRSVILPAGAPQQHWAGTDCEYVSL